MSENQQNQQNTTAHSGGPWRIDEWNYPTATPPRRDLVIVNEHYRLAVIDWDEGKPNPYTIPEHAARANAALMAAAPELLEACQSALALINISTEYAGMSTAQELQRAIQQAAGVETPTATPTATPMFTPTATPTTAMELDGEGKALNDLAGLRNQIRMIQRAADDGNLREVGYQLTALLDDLQSPTVRFEWSSAQDKAAAEEQDRDAMGQASLDNPSMFD